MQFKVTLETIYKNFRVFKVFLEKLLKFKLDGKIHQLISDFVLYLPSINYIF